jgi:hypothetical protein
MAAALRTLRFMCIADRFTITIECCFKCEDEVASDGAAYSTISMVLGNPVQT